MRYYQISLRHYTRKVHDGMDDLEEEKEEYMKLTNKVKLIAWLLGAAVLITEVCGNSVVTYAVQLQEETGSGNDELLEQPDSGKDGIQDRMEVSGDNGSEQSERIGMDDNSLSEGQIEDLNGTSGTLQQNLLKSENLQGQEAQEPTPEEAFAALLQEYDMYGVLSNNTDIPIYQEPSQGSSVMKKLPSGYQVRFLGVVLEVDELWFQVAFGMNDVEYTGYVQSSFVVSGDTRLEEWKQQNLNELKRRAAGIKTANVLGGTNLSSFPSSYRTYIKKLIQAHPNWTFVPMNTGLKWSEVLKNEMVNSRNLVDINHPFNWKSTAPEDYNAATGKWIIKNGKTWVQASEPIVMFYLDPRNFLSETSVFQFEQLTYNSAYHTESGVEKILSGTFMSKKKLEDGSGGGITYAKAFMKIGKALKVSPYFLASRIRQEQGVNGTSKLISGTYPGFEGYYNYFNISATGIGEEVIISGLTEAKNEGWTTRYAALYGGARKTAENYISKGQDTFYLQKFDVDASYHGLYWHQYMQNLLAADNEASNIRNSYNSMGVINNSFVFKVPVYESMPSSLCPLPGDSLSKPTLKATKNGYTSVKLSWNQVGGASGYRVYRKEGAKGSYVRLKTLNGSTATSYTDKKVSPGKVYYYKVRAFVRLNSGTQYSKYSSEKKVSYAIPATSWTKFAVKNYTAVKMTWKKASVSGYRIYRKIDSGKYVHIQSVKGKDSIAFTDKTILPGHTYSYKIRGYKTIGGKNYFSSYTSVKTAKINMDVPKLSSISISGVNKAKLTWKQDSKATGYYVYRSTKEKGGYKKVKAIDSNKVLKWTDSSIKPGTTYYYRIRSYVKSSYGKKSSSYSRVLMVKTKITKPTLSTVSASAAGVKLKWKKNDDATGYQIYRSASYGGKYTSLKKVTKNSTVTFTDKNVTLGKTYYYKVRAYKTIGKKNQYSKWSSIVCAQPELAETQFTKISGISSSKAALKWKQISEAHGYKLYRKTGINGKYQAVKTVTNSKTTSYTDQGLKKNKVYYYRIRTWKKVDGKVRYSAYSNAWCVQTK